MKAFGCLKHGRFPPQHQWPETKEWPEECESVESPEVVLVANGDDGSPGIEMLFFLSNKFLCVVLMPGSFAHLQILWQCVDFHTGECSIQNWQWVSICGSCEDCCLWCQNHCPLSFDAWKCYLNWHRVDTLSIVRNDVRELEQAQLAQYARCIVFTQNKLLQNTSAWWHWFESSGSCR